LGDKKVNNLPNIYTVNKTHIEEAKNAFKQRKSAIVLIRNKEQIVFGDFL